MERAKSGNRVKSRNQFNSVTQSCATLCHRMDCSTPGFPVHHQLPEIIQPHVHRISDAIQLSHPLSPSSPPAFNLSQGQDLFQWVCSSHLVAKSINTLASASVLPENIQGWFPLGLTGLISLLFKGHSSIFSGTTFQMHQFFRAQPSLWSNSHICTCIHASVLSHFSCVQLFVTLWTVVHEALLSMRFSRQECWSGLPCSPPCDIPDTGIECVSPVILALQADSYQVNYSHQGSPIVSDYWKNHSFDYTDLC